MANIFPKSANHWPIKIAFGLLCIWLLAVIGLWYYFTPQYTHVGYEPRQPIAFSHAIHGVQLGMSCTYCHSQAAETAHSNIPTTQVCNNCHRPGGVQWDNPKIAPLRESIEQNKPIRWVQVYKLPDFAYFNHSAHVNRGVGCRVCHGIDIDQRGAVRQVSPLSMGWCLDCHRAPEKYVKPLHVTPSPTGGALHPAPPMSGKAIVSAWNIRPPTNCSGCHR